MSTPVCIHEQKQGLGFKRVLVAMDFSPASERALACAIPLVKHYVSELSIIHAMPPASPAASPFGVLPPVPEGGQFQTQKMEQIAETSSVKELNPRTLLLHGPIWHVLSSVIQRDEIDLLVLGTHGRGGLRKFALGSVAEKVLHLATCPVLTIGPNVPQPSPAGFRTILFATDFGPSSAKAFPYALSLAEEYSAHLILLHMIPPIPIVDVAALAYCPGPLVAQDLTTWLTARREISLDKLKELVPADTKLASQPECIVEMEVSPEQILNTAEAHNADLIVMGANPVSSEWAASHLPWALTHAVLCKSACPILTVKA